MLIAQLYSTEKTISTVGNLSPKIECLAAGNIEFIRHSLATLSIPHFLLGFSYILPLENSGGSITTVAYSSFPVAQPSVFHTREQASPCWTMADEISESSLGTNKAMQKAKSTLFLLTCLALIVSKDSSFKWEPTITKALLNLTVSLYDGS